MEYEGARGAQWAFPEMFSEVLGFKVTWSDGARNLASVHSYFRDPLSLYFTR